MSATQRCRKCGSPLRPCKCKRDRGRSVPNSTLRTRTTLSTTKPLTAKKKIKARSFSERYDGTGEEYGPVFRIIRLLPCWLALVGYFGPGHEACGRGEQGGHTAHHVGKTDAEGMLPGCGRAHDLYANRGSARTQRTFRAWLAERGYDLVAVALMYYRRHATDATVDNEGG